MFKAVVTVSAFIVLVGCSDPEDKIYESFKCAKAATYMGEDDLANIAMNKSEPYAKDVDFGGSPAKFFMELGQRFQDDYPLYKYNTKGQVEIIKDLYESDDCQDLYKP